MNITNKQLDLLTNAIYRRISEYREKSIKKEIDKIYDKHYAEAVSELQKYVTKLNELKKEYDEKQEKLNDKIKEIRNTYLKDISSAFYSSHRSITEEKIKEHLLSKSLKIPSKNEIAEEIILSEGDLNEVMERIFDKLK